MYKISLVNKLAFLRDIFHQQITDIVNIHKLVTIMVYQYKNDH